MLTCICPVFCLLAFVTVSPVDEEGIPALGLGGGRTRNTGQMRRPAGY